MYLKNFKQISQIFWKKVYLLFNLFTIYSLFPTILSSSNSDNAVDFGAGTKNVFCTQPASKAVYLNAAGDPVGAASVGEATALAVALG